MLDDGDSLRKDFIVTLLGDKRNIICDVTKVLEKLDVPNGIDTDRTKETHKSSCEVLIKYCP